MSSDPVFAAGGFRDMTRIAEKAIQGCGPYPLNKSRSHFGAAEDFKDQLDKVASD